MRKPGYALLILLSVHLSAEAATRVALVSTEAGPMDNVLMLVEARVAALRDVQLLDRKHIHEVLAEHKLALSGLADPEQAIRAGQLLGVDLFAVVETDAKEKKTLGLVVFNGRSGVRLWDAAVTKEGLDAAAMQIGDGIERAVGKYNAKPQDLHTVGLLTVRNADLPRSMDSTVEALGRLLERQVLQSPGVVLVERDRLRHIIQERNLPTRDPLPPLLASLNLIELEVGRDNNGSGFKATARITDAQGKEVARPEFAARDLYALVAGLLPELLKALHVETAGNPLNRIKEADRFSRESSLHWSHREYGRAALEAEAACALDPESYPRLRWLIHRIADAAIELVDPGQQNYGGPPKNPVDPIQLERSIEIARHGLELQPLMLQRAMAKPDWIRGAYDLSVNAYSIYLGKIVVFDKATTPRSRQLVQDFAEEYRKHEMQSLGKVLYEEARAGRGFKQYTSWVSSPALLDIFHRYPLVYDGWSQMAADLLTQWAELADAQHPSKTPDLMRVCDYVLMTVRWCQRVPRLNENDVNRLRQAYQSLEMRSDPVLNLHGRLLMLTLDQQTAKVAPGSAPEPDSTRQAVRELVSKVEPFVLADGPQQTPETRKRWIDFVQRAHDLLPADDRHEANRRFYDMLESHNQYSQLLSSDIAGFYTIRKQPQSALKFVWQAIALLEKKPEGLTEAERIQELNRLRASSVALQQSLGIATTTVTPWASAKALLDVDGAQDGIRSIVRPVVSGRNVYALGMNWNLDARQVAFTLLRLDIDRGTRDSLGTFTLDGLQPATFNQRTKLEDGEINLLTTIERSTTEGSYFIRSACIAGDKYYAATLGKGILEFPLRGGPPRQIDERAGIPSDYVQALTSCNGSLYAWLGQPRKTAYLVRLKLDDLRQVDNGVKSETPFKLSETSINVIASSRRTLQRTPLDNVAPVVCDFMCVDAPRERIVFRLTSNGSDDSLGLWELALASDRLRQLKRTHLILSGYPPRLVPDGRILIKDGGRAHLFDLKTNEFRELVLQQAAAGGGAGSAGFRTEQTDTWTSYSFVFLPIALLGDELWVGYPFGRIHLKTGQFDRFPSLRDEKATFQPGVFFEQVGEREYLLADPAALWLLKLKPAAERAPAAGQ